MYQSLCTTTRTSTWDLDTSLFETPREQHSSQAAVYPSTDVPNRQSGTPLPRIVSYFPLPEVHFSV